ncbi:MAG TPA: hypothetical protein VMP01_04710 [Pirellulaceae bacterium]|nr:hypothetical protein [Pirellulaceae bacterium]
MTDVNIIDSPREGDDVECCNVGGAAGDPVLDVALGHSTTLLEVVAVQARVNGAAWTDGIIVFSEQLDPGGFSTAWEVGSILKVDLAGNNRLEVRVKLSDGTWLTTATPVNFTAFCTMHAVLHAARLSRVRPAATLFVRITDTYPPTASWALLTSQLAESQAVRLKRKRRPGPLSVWVSKGGKPIWTLRMLTSKVAELIMRLPVRRRGARAATLVQRWVSGKFSSQKGGDFLPTGGTLPIPLILKVRRTRRG